MKTFLKSIVVGILTLEARLFLARFKPFVIAVTGTVGKTSAKDAIAAALAPFASVRKSEKSYNSEIGVPLAILGARNQWNNPLGWFFVLLRGLFLLVTRYTLQVTRHPRFLVVEVGTDRPGDIRAIARWLRPTMVVVTKLSRAPVHIENFSSASELVAEKGALVSALQKDGILILNGDDADVRAFRALAPGRMRMLDGVNGARIIDDTYNSSPVAVAEALTALSGLETRGRRIAVLGDMLELGILSEAEHDKMVRDAVEKADIVFLVGERACAAVAAAFASGFPAEKIRTFADSRACGEALAQEIRAGDVALIKGSQGIRMERVVERVLAERSRASELLVRQEKEWKNR